MLHGHPLRRSRHQSMASPALATIGCQYIISGHTRRQLGSGRHRNEEVRTMPALAKQACWTAAHESNSTGCLGRLLLKIQAAQYCVCLGRPLSWMCTMALCASKGMHRLRSTMF